MTKLANVLLAELNKPNTTGLSLVANIGISPATINKIIRRQSRTVDLDTLYYLCSYFNLSYDELFGNTLVNRPVAIPCSASPVCQDICHICEGLSDYWKNELLEYAQFISEEEYEAKMKRLMD